ncbi:MAG: tetratricopeptide repeat protein, partial [Thermodesulfobacteriota bacterium]
MLRTDPGLILTALLTVLFLSTQASAAYGFYTIQTGTYDYRPYAVEQLSFIRDNLKGHDLTYLRVVEFRKLFAVRAGRFSDRAAANRYLSPLRTLYPDAFILSVKHERVSYALKDPTPAPPPRKEDIPGKDPATIHEKAKELSRRGEYRRALSLLSPFVSDPMRYPAIVSDYIVLLIWEGREGKAIRLYESLPPPFPRRIYLLENMGRAYYDEGAFKDASRLYQAALAQDPSDLEARKGIIYSAIKMGKWPLAAKHLEVLLTRHPSPVSAASEVAGVLLSSGLYGETLDLYRIIDKRGDATGEEGFRARDNLLASLPEATRETMITALLEKAKDEGRDAVADYILLLILNREYEKAVAYLEERELDPSSLADNMTAQIAWAYFKTGDTERAKEYYRDILSSRPDYLRAELGLAYCFAVEGNDDGAMEILDRLAATEPGSVEVRFARAFAHERTGRLWETIKEYDHITTLSPDDPTARRLKLQAMSDLGMTTQAIEAASRELPHDRDLIDNLRGDQAIDHLYWDETDKALDILRALMKDEDNMRARFDTIAALIRNGNGEEALEEYEELLD